MSNTSPSPTLGFVGLGNMGTPLCRHLLSTGARVIVLDLNPTALENMVAQGAQPAANAADLGRNVGDGIIFLSLTNTRATRSVLEGNSEHPGLASTLAPGALVVDHGSNQVDATEEWAALVRPRGAAWLDAAVSGGVVGAEAGDLTIMCGGAEPDFERALPWLQRYGDVIEHLGPTGCGQVAKLANQLIVAANIATVSEAFALARAHGLDLVKVRRALLGGFAASRVLDLHGQRMLDRNFKPGGTATNQLKDVDEAVRLATQHGVNLPMLAANRAVWADMIEAGLGDLDHSGLFAHYDQPTAKETSV